VSRQMLFLVEPFANEDENFRECGSPVSPIVGAIADTKFVGDFFVNHEGV